MNEKVNRTLLIVEDDPGLQSQLRWCFEGYDVHISGDRNTAINFIKNNDAPVVTLDLGLPPDPANVSEGFKTLEEILDLKPETKVIVVTGNDDNINAVRAIGLGAYDFYQKPVDPEILGLIVNRAYRLYELEEQNKQLQQEHIRTPLPGLIANSIAMQEVSKTIEKVAPTNVSTLLLGESGTGKELLARALHDLSSRSTNKFIAINCAAIPENLLESELFGYEKGSFTGANKRTVGKLETSNGGTLLLDEIGDLPMSLQAKLLRFLQERVIERIGGREEIPVDVRIVCATHQNLTELIDAGKFREDLYYRISEIVIKIPPLRERDGDAVLIARFLIDSYAREQGKTAPELTSEAMSLIENYNWPGNIRELTNRVKRAVIMCEKNRITGKDLELIHGGIENRDKTLKEIREEAERKAIIQALTISNGNISQAAKHLGVSRPTLYDMINRFEINQS
jgi:two-component system NtrC family response regulator